MAPVTGTHVLCLKKSALVFMKWRRVLNGNSWQQYTVRMLLCISRVASSWGRGLRNVQVVLSQLVHDMH